MAKKATHRGACQLCGHDQKLPGGKLSLHGYAVMWATFVGSCPGSRGLPLEVSFDLIEAAEKLARENAASARASAAKVREDRSVFWVLEYRPATWDRRHSGYEWRALKLDEVEIGPFSYSYQNRYTKRTDRYAARGDIHAEANGAKADAIEAKAAELDRYADWLDERLRTWKPGTLRPVEG